MYLVFFLIVFILVSLLYIKYKSSVGLCTNCRHLVGKVAIVTGANSGIGFETALDLAERGARVIITSRNENKGTTARDLIIKKSGNSDVRFFHLDLLSLKSIRKFVDDVLAQEKRLDILINNAGAYYEDIYISDDGLQAGMQTNYFGPFLLTNLLLPLLVTSTPSRIINVASEVYKYGNIDVSDLNMASVSKRYFAKHSVYVNAKFCIALMTVELHRRLQGKGVTVNFLHPGLISTNVVKSNTIVHFLNYVRPYVKWLLKTPKMGAQTSIYLATSLELQNTSGRYFVDCREVDIDKKALDLNLAKELWMESVKLVNL